MNWTWFLFSFEGRINRAKFWLASLIWFVTIYSFMTIFTWVVVGLFLAFGHDSHSVSNKAIHLVFTKTNHPAFYLIGFPLLVIFVWLFAATVIKRLHDRGRSGLWFATFFITPLLLGKLSDWLDDTFLAFPAGMVTLVLCVWCFVELFCMRGAKEPNRFGPDPLTPVVPVAPPDTRPNWDQLREVEYVPQSAGPSPSPHVNRGA